MPSSVNRSAVIGYSALTLMAIIASLVIPLPFISGWLFYADASVVAVAVVALVVLLRMKL